MIMGINSKCAMCVAKLKKNIRYEVHMISFQTFFAWALLLIVHT